MLVYLARRLFYGALVVFATAVFAYGGIRALRPDRYPGQGWLDGTWHDTERALVHFDFGTTCVIPSCPQIRTLWADGIVIDLGLVFGALILGATLGTVLGRWCAAHRGSVGARTLETGAMFFYSCPPYLLAFGALLAFDPFFGVLPVPFLIDPTRFNESFATVPDFLRGMLLPILLCAMPVVAVCLRLTVGLTAEAANEDYVRTALAKGLSPAAAIRRHAAPAARVPVASHVGAAIPTILLNVVLVEFVWPLPGFFKHTWRAFGKVGSDATPDYTLLQAIGIWAAVLIAFVSVVADLAIVALDPRVRAAGRL